MHKTILIAPLDWGLGHATRCIPLIQYLQELNCQVIIAGYGDQLNLLQKEFPDLKIISLKGYNVRYSVSKRMLALKILLQSPKILLTIYKEHQWLQKKIKELNISLVISDNRYGLNTKKAPCIFITHQLYIQAPYKWLQTVLQKVNYNYINRFTRCWVPDFKGNTNIAGALSHPVKMPSIPVEYLGILSRFEVKKNIERKYDYLFIFSGPEPQRTILERKVLNIVPLLKGSVIIVRGKPRETKMPEKMANCTITNHLVTNKLRDVIAGSEFVISRCGYTTVMELLSLQKKAILIPTPGQTEQEYLARHLMQQQWLYSFNQNEDLFHHIQYAKQFPYQFPIFPIQSFKKTVEDFIKTEVAEV